MQLCNVIVRLGGSITNTVPRSNVTPAEILVLKHIHGDDAVVDIRPTKFDKSIRQEAEYDRLAAKYDAGAGSFVSKPGEDRKSVMGTLFPGALKRLPATLEEIGIDCGPMPVVVEPTVDAEPDAQDETDETEEPDATEGGENAAGGGEEAAA